MKRSILTLTILASLLPLASCSFDLPKVSTSSSEDSMSITHDFLSLSNPEDGVLLDSFSATKVVESAYQNSYSISYSEQSSWAFNDENPLAYYGYGQDEYYEYFEGFRTTTYSGNLVESELSLDREDTISYDSSITVSYFLTNQYVDGNTSYNLYYRTVPNPEGYGTWTSLYSTFNDEFEAKEAYHLANLSLHGLAALHFSTDHNFVKSNNRVYVLDIDSSLDTETNPLYPNDSTRDLSLVRNNIRQWVYEAVDNSETNYRIVEQYMIEQCYFISDLEGHLLETPYLYFQAYTEQEFSYAPMTYKSYSEPIDVNSNNYAMFNIYSQGSLSRYVRMSNVTAYYSLYHGYEVALAFEYRFSITSNITFKVGFTSGEVYGFSDLSSYSDSITRDDSNTENGIAITPGYYYVSIAIDNYGDIDSFSVREVYRA